MGLTFVNSFYLPNIELKYFRIILNKKDFYYWYLPFIIKKRIKRYKHHFFTCILIKKNVLESVGGYQSMKNVISEDVVLARLVKKYGYKTVFIDCKQAASCRMYNNYRESVQGLSKNIFSFGSIATLRKAGI